MCNTLLRLRLKSFLALTSLSSEESVEKAPDHKLASKPAKTRLEPKEAPKEQPPEAGFEFARSLPGSHSRHIESQESVVDDPVEHDDIEEVVEPADPNPESKDQVTDGHHKETAEVAKANREPIATPFPPAESVEKAPDHILASKPAKTRLEPRETPKEQPPELAGSSLGDSRRTQFEESAVDDPMENGGLEEVVEPADPNRVPKDQVTDGHHKETAEVAKANREPIATPFPPAESVEKALPTSPASGSISFRAEAQAFFGTAAEVHEGTTFLPANALGKEEDGDIFFTPRKVPNRRISRSVIGSAEEWHSCDSSESMEADREKRRKNSTVSSDQATPQNRSRSKTQSPTPSPWAIRTVAVDLPEVVCDGVTSPGRAMQPRHSSCPPENGAATRGPFHLPGPIPTRPDRGRAGQPAERPADLTSPGLRPPGPSSPSTASPTSPTSPAPSPKTSSSKPTDSPKPEPDLSKQPDSPKPSSSPKGKGAPPKGKGKDGKGKDAGKGKGKAKAEPRKPDIKPGVQVKRLFWNSFRVDSGRNTVWNEIDLEGAPIDLKQLQQLEELFCDEPGKRFASPSPEDRDRVKKIQVLDTQRRRQVCVMLARLPNSLEVARALQSMDFTALDSEQVELLLINLPSDEEIKLLQRAKSEHTIDELHVWDQAEEFLLTFIEVPQFELRLRAWHFQNAFEERFQTLASALRCVSEGCQCVLTSTCIRHLLGIVLHVGNYLNGGTPRGRADGFALDTLLLMRTVKMSQENKAGTLVDYIVAQMERGHSGDLQKVFAPGGEFELLKAAARHKAQDLADELRAFRATADQVHQKLFGDESLISCRELLESRRENLAGLEDELKLMESNYEEIVVWFSMEDKGIRKPTDEFFGIWAKFLADVQMARKAFEEQALKEKRKNSMTRRFSVKLERSRRSLTPRRSEVLPSPSRQCSEDAMTEAMTEDGREEQ
ncbi:unnamed protein product [Durusdinium trenchii]|uniref:FH2 domain-containing protein n=1 Tax=Durusdinium trenchii TaxID=1381693 RepID=A0ABP0IE72_9DINO